MIIISLKELSILQYNIRLLQFFISILIYQILRLFDMQITQVATSHRIMSFQSMSYTVESLDEYLSRHI